MRLSIGAALAVALLALGGASASAKPARPDLQVTSLVDAPSPFLSGADFSTEVRVTNKSHYRTPATTTRFYLSPNKEIDDSATLIGTRGASRLRPGHSSVRGLRMTVPRSLPPGSYWFIACADGTEKVRESIERNNCFGGDFSMDVLMPVPDGP